MSDPTARRGDNVQALLEAMRKDISKNGRGWAKRKMKKFLLKSYRFGVRDQTIDAIIKQLVENDQIVGKPLSPHSPLILWYPTVESNIEYERENKRGKEKEKEGEREKESETEKITEKGRSGIA